MAVNVIGTLNTRGIRRKLKNLLHTLGSDNIGLLGLQETILNESTNIDINGYRTYWKDYFRQGLALLIHNSIPAVRHDLPATFDNLQTIAVDEQLPCGTVTVINYYNRPADELNYNLFYYADSLPHAIILGDFNARSQNLHDVTNNSNGHRLEMVLLGTVLVHIHNETPTFLEHQGISIPDPILHSPSLTHLFEDTSYIGTTTTSDHLPLLV